MVAVEHSLRLPPYIRLLFKSVAYRSLLLWRRCRGTRRMRCSRHKSNKKPPFGGRWHEPASDGGSCGTKGKDVLRMKHINPSARDLPHPRSSGAPSAGSLLVTLWHVLGSSRAPTPYGFVVFYCFEQQTDA